MENILIIRFLLFQYFYYDVLFYLILQNHICWIKERTCFIIIRTFFIFQLTTYFLGYKTKTKPEAPRVLFGSLTENSYWSWPGNNVVHNFGREQLAE